MRNGISDCPAYIESTAQFPMGALKSMFKSFLAAVALTIGLASAAVADEAAHRHHHHLRHHTQALSSPDPQSAPPSDPPDIYWSPAGGNPIHYGQTTGFYAGGR
jgi:hypothetical protein